MAGSRSGDIGSGADRVQLSAKDPEAGVSRISGENLSFRVHKMTCEVTRPPEVESGWGFTLGTLT